MNGAVGGKGKDEPPGERSAHPEAERAQPEEGRAAGAQVAEEDEQVPGGDGAEQSFERPEDDRERPAREVRARLGLGLEAVGVEPRLGGASELMAGEPELPDRLQVVSRGRRSRSSRQALGEEVGACLAQRGPGRDDARREEDD